jgi:hypothetical protein
MAAAAWAGPSLLRAAGEETRRRLSWEFRPADGEPAGLAPPGLTVAENPTLRLDIEAVEPASKTILEPESWGWARLSVKTRAGEAEGWTPLRVFVSNERELRVARERYGLPAVPAKVSVTVENGRLKAVIAPHGAPTMELSGVVGSAETGGQTAPSALLVWTAEPARDWTGAGGLVSGAVVRRVELKEPSSPGRLCEGLEASWPVGETVSALWFDGLDAARADSVAGAALANVTAVDAAAWAALSYPLPLAAAPAAPFGPARAPRSSLEGLRKERELLLGPMEICELDIMVSQEAHEAMLPPVARSGGRPMLKIMGLRVHESMLSTEPFQEVWLFAFAIVGGRAGWYAVSHITDPQGDPFHGREAFGYPTKLGSPEVIATPTDFQVVVNRLGREVFYSRGMFRGFATGTSLGQLPVLTLRARRGGESAEILYQPWTFQGRRSRVDPPTLEVTFSGAKAAGLSQLTDPWSELDPPRPIAVSAMDGAQMQRGPAEKVLDWPDFGEHYRERCDGALPWEPSPLEPLQPTLLVSGPNGSRT